MRTDGPSTDRGAPTPTRPDATAPARPDRRRSARRARSAAAAAQGRGLPDRVGRLPGRRSSRRSTATDFDAVLMDLNYARDTTSGQEGLDLLSQLRSHDPTLPVVVMTAWGSVDVAVEAMRRGARDFVQKPWDNARLLTILRTQVELARALRRQQRLEAENRSLKPDVRPLLIAEAPSMRPVLELISARRAVGRQRAHHRRERHRQRHGRAGDPRGVGARRQGARHRQRRRARRRASSRASCSAT